MSPLTHSLQKNPIEVSFQCLDFAGVCHLQCHSDCIWSHVLVLLEALAAKQWPASESGVVDKTSNDGHLCWHQFLCLLHPPPPPVDMEIDETTNVFVPTTPTDSLPAICCAISSCCFKLATSSSRLLCFFSLTFVFFQAVLFVKFSSSSSLLLLSCCCCCCPC